MNKIVIGIIAVVIVVSGAYVVLSSKDDEAMKTELPSTVTTTQEQQSTPSSLTVEPVSDSNYQEYSPEALQSVAKGKKVVFFHAPWCSTCVFFDNQINEQGVPDGLTIFRADFDNDTAAKNRFDVDVRSTFVLLDENDNVVRTWPFASGLRSIQDLYDAVI